MMKIREINCVDEFKSIRGTWNDLLGKSRDRNHIFNMGMAFQVVGNTLALTKSCKY